jgi:hypothetical protein
MRRPSPRRSRPDRASGRSQRRLGLPLTDRGKGRGIAPLGRHGRSHLILATMGVALYLTTLWFGIVVIGDNPIRSALMAALIVLIAAVGYVFTRRPVTPDD